jgi:pimeloyl-ACP methyl ester carboxylesterase
MKYQFYSADQEFSIDLPDGKKLYFIFNQADQSIPHKGLLVLSHGLTGKPREFVHITAKNEFNNAGYDVVRVQYYGAPEDARDLVEYTAKIHGEDLAAVVQHFRPQYQKLFVAGHSYGGFAMAHAFAVDGGKTFNPNAVSFWDATFTPAWYQDAKHWPESGTYSYRNGQDPRMGQAMFDEAKFYNENPPYDLYGQFNIPAQVVLALENEKPGRGREEVFKALNCQKERVGINGADHQFTLGNTAQQLCHETLRWFDMF